MSYTTRMSLCPDGLVELAKALSIDKNCVLLSSKSLLHCRQRDDNQASTGDKYRIDDDHNQVIRGDMVYIGIKINQFLPPHLLDYIKTNQFLSPSIPLKDKVPHPLSPIHHPRPPHSYR